MPASTTWPGRETLQSTNCLSSLRGTRSVAHPRSAADHPIDQVGARRGYLHRGLDEPVPPDAVEQRRAAQHLRRRCSRSSSSSPSHRHEPTRAPPPMTKTSRSPAVARARSIAAAGPSVTKVKSWDAASRYDSGARLVTTKIGGRPSWSAPPYPKLAAYRQERGWAFPGYSSYGSDFNYDYHVSLDPVGLRPTASTSWWLKSSRGLPWRFGSSTQLSWGAARRAAPSCATATRSSTQQYATATEAATCSGNDVQYAGSLPAPEWSWLRGSACGSRLSCLLNWRSSSPNFLAMGVDVGIGDGLFQRGVRLVAELAATFSGRSFSGESRASPAATVRIAAIAARAGRP